MKEQTVIYIHGKGGSAAEAEHYRPLFPDASVLGLDYLSETPWEAKAELPKLFDAVCGREKGITLIANSIGAYFAMIALSDKPINRAFFISPVVDMEKLIRDMMIWADIREEELREKGEIETPFGETLSWEYLCYVRDHLIHWEIPTHILYGENDHLCAWDTVSAFAAEHGATLDVMRGGEHWFHTEAQMAYLDEWLKKYEEKADLFTI